jgi:hypothetical protein
MSEPFADLDWDGACRKADVIREFLRRVSGPTTTAQMRELADELRLSQASAYRLLKLFRAGGTVLSLVGRKAGRPCRPQGSRRSARRNHPGRDQALLPEEEPPVRISSGA